MSDYDVIIVGGGIAGATAALALARSGRRCLLAESARQPGRKIGDTLGAQARPCLQALGLWEEFSRAGHLESWGNFSAWGEGEPVERDFIFNPYGCSWQIDRPAFEGMILRAAVAAGVDIRWQHALSSARRHSGQWEVATGSGSARAPWLVDATGRRAVMARSLGAKRQVVDRLVALYSVWECGDPGDQDSRTLIESCREGWWYSSLLPGGRRVVSLQTDSDLLESRSWRGGEWFTGMLAQTRHLSGMIRAQNYRLSGVPHLTTAQSGRLSEPCGAGWLAVGDAAMSFDPLSGLGMQKAMQSAIEATNLPTSAGTGKLADFRDRHESGWQRYLTDRDTYYTLERQWPGSEFWQRRQQQGLVQT